MIKNIFRQTVRFALIALFLYTAIDKIINFSTFSSQLRQSPILEPVAGLVEWMIPAIELLVVLLLISPIQRLKGLYASFFLLILFTGYLVVLRYFSYYIPCDCGGFLEKLPPGLHILLNLSFALFAFAGIKMEKQARKKDAVKLRSMIYS